MKTPLFLRCEWEGRAKLDKSGSYCCNWCKSKSIVNIFSCSSLSEKLGKNTLFPRENSPSMVKMEGSGLIKYLEDKVDKT